jgi:SAM-dependent methyltransferase
LRVSTGTVEYDRQARAYGRARVLPRSALGAWREALAPYLSTLPDGRVLDLGSGTGAFATALAEWFSLDVVGIEPSMGMIAEALRENAHPRVTYIRACGESLPVGDASCAAAWLSTVVHQIEDLPACVRELRRVLRNGAPVLIRGAFPGRLDRITLFRLFPGARRVAECFPTVEQVALVFGSAGFALERVEQVAQVSASSLRAALERLPALRHADSTMAGLDDAEFAAGFRAAERAVDGEGGDSPVVVELTLVVLRRSHGGRM